MSFARHVDGSGAPRLLFADEDGRIYDHPDLLAAGRWGREEMLPGVDEWIPLPGLSRLFFLPKCPPRGIDPVSGKVVTLETYRMLGRKVRCAAVSAFLEPGYARTLLPSADTSRKDYVLPLWAYTAVGFTGDGYVACAFQVAHDPKWDPRNFDDRHMISRLKARLRSNSRNPLLKHLAHCAQRHHCFAAKNLFMERWEAPLPVSQRCNAHCLACLSHQPRGSCPPAHDRITFRPEVGHILEIALPHLERAVEPIVSFGQGCEGEPLTEAPLICRAVQELRSRTSLGTINLNTNGSLPGEIRSLAQAGLDSVRISLNSARPALYHRYVRPKGFSFDDVERSLVVSREANLFTMINYLIFPGISDQEEELEQLLGLIARTGVNFLHFKNLCMDPDLYLQAMPESHSPRVGMREMARRIREMHPEVQIGYFNQPARVSAGSAPA